MKKTSLLVMFMVLGNMLVSAQHNCCKSNSSLSTTLERHTKSYAALDEEGKLVPYEFELREVGEHDVLIEILYSGVCHSDIHQAHGHWGNSLYPMVPGHEITGRVLKVGSKVKGFKVGDYAGVGAMINSCGECANCKAGKEQFCLNKKTVYTYNNKDFEHNYEVTKGGYAKKIVVKDHFVFKIPKSAPIEKIGPLFCAGITVYSPLKKAEIKKGDKIGIAGFGGLGHLAVKYAVSMGADVTVFDISEEKREIALKMGATKFVNVNKPEDLRGLNSSFKTILSLIPAKFDVAMYIKMLQYGGELVLIGQPALDQVPDVSTQVFVENPGRKMYFSLIGGVPETKEMLDYSIKHNIYPDIEIISMQDINDAFKKVVAGEVRFRYVIDMSTLK